MPAVEKFERWHEQRGANTRQPELPEMRATGWKNRPRRTTGMAFGPCFCYVLPNNAITALTASRADKIVKC
jgi:hypothetical protein